MDLVSGVFLGEDSLDRWLLAAELVEKGSLEDLKRFVIEESLIWCEGAMETWLYSPPLGDMSVAALAGLGDRVCVCEAAHVVGGAAEEVEAVGDLEAGGAFHFRYQRHCVGGEDGGVFNGLG